MTYIDTGRPPYQKGQQPAKQPRKRIRASSGKALTSEETRYYGWLHNRCKCIVTGQPQFDIAHTGGLPEGKGMGIKANCNTCLPLIRPLHEHEEKNRALFWPTVGLPDHLEIAGQLFVAFKANQDPFWILEEAWTRVDHEYVRAILGEIDF